jgi:hypothetical protein
MRGVYEEERLAYLLSNAEAIVLHWPECLLIPEDELGHRSVSVG